VTLRAARDSAVGVAPDRTLPPVRPFALAVSIALVGLGVRAAERHLARRSLPAATGLAAAAQTPRGRIVDARGEILADNVPRWELDVKPARLRARPDATARLAALLGERPAALDAALSDRGQRVQRLRRYLDDAEADAVRRSALPGVWVTPVARRVYPQGAVTAAAVGHLRDVGPDDVLIPYGHRLGDRVGAAGIERSWDLTLRGASTLAPTRQGMTLVTHLDLRLVQAAWGALGDEGGEVVALDPRDGRVLALVARRTAGAGRGDRPLGPRPLGAMLDPLVASLARSHGVTLPPRALRPAEAARSFAAAHLDLGTALRRVGLGRPTGIDLRDEPAGAQETDARWRATALQIAVAYGAIANGGTVYQPRIVDAVKHPDGAEESRTTPVVADRVELPTDEPPRALAALARWAEAHREGTGRGLSAWGAWGADGWCVALAPAAAPRVVVVVRTAGRETAAESLDAETSSTHAAAVAVLDAWHRSDREGR
jgi:cell division protein FtsI/penicillin-binding protein 2